MDDELRKALDRLMEPPSIEPLPGDSFGLFRKESDASLRARIKQRKESNGGW